MMAAWLLAAAEIFMTGSQPLQSSLCNRGYLSIYLRPLLQKWCRWHQRKKKAQHTYLLLAHTCVFILMQPYFEHLSCLPRTIQFYSYFAGVICSSLAQRKLSFGATSTNIFIQFFKKKHFFFVACLLCKYMINIKLVIFSWVSTYCSILIAMKSCVPWFAPQVYTNSVG